jgi:hypothetical protein
MQEVYRDVTGSLTGYLDWFDIFEDLQVDFDDNREKEYFWDMFLRSFYLSTGDSGYIRRGGPGDPGRFYQETGIPPSAIDWAGWRDLMGYSNRR